MIGRVQQPEMGNQTRMPFTMAVVHEVQRFGDIVPLGLPHMTSRDTEVQGFLIPKVGLQASLTRAQPHLQPGRPSKAKAREGPGPQFAFPQASAIPVGAGGVRAVAGPALSLQSPGEDKLKCATGCWRSLMHRTGGSVGAHGW